MQWIEKYEYFLKLNPFTRKILLIIKKFIINWNLIQNLVTYFARAREIRLPVQLVAKSRFIQAINRETTGEKLRNKPNMFFNEF